MVYKYLEHEADVGLRVEADSLEGLFVDAASGLFSLMYDPKKVKDKESVAIEITSDSGEYLFVDFLNEVLSLASLRHMFFSSCQIDAINVAPGRYHLRGILKGEKSNPAKHNPKTEVKAATYSGLEFKDDKGHYSAQCLLDV